MVRDTVRSWISERFLPVVMEHFEKGTFPMELVPELADLGVFGPTTPEEYGGAGMNSVAYGLICQELERGDSGLRSFCSVQGSLVMWPIHAYGSEEQKREYLPKLASGEMIGCFGLTEPDFGSNPGGMLTTAKRDGGDYIINGRKMWITTAACPTSRSCGPRSTASCAASSSLELDDSALPTTTTSGPCAPPTPASSCSRTSASPSPRCCPTSRPARPALLPHPGPLRHHGGAQRLRVLRRDPRLPEGAHRLRQADRRVPDPAAEVRQHGDRHHLRASPRSALGRLRTRGASSGPVSSPSAATSRSPSTSAAPAATCSGQRRDARVPDGPPLLNLSRS